MSGKARRGSGEGSVYQDTKGVWHAKLNLGRYKNGKRRFKEFQGKRKADVIARLNSYRREYFDALYARYQCRELNKTQLAAAVGVSRPTLERLLHDYLA